MRAVVVGYGSIGERHARILQNLEVKTAVVSSRTIDFPIVYTVLTEAIEHFNPDYIVVANKTSEHYSTLSQLANQGWGGTVLVEKPLFHEMKELPAAHNMRIFVAYNLRFHPVLIRLRAALQEERILSVTAYAGQYLPDWRPQRDYRMTYSARKEEGGGVLRDLSHELDYLIWLFGPWVRLTALGGHFSSLATTGDDFCGVLMETENCPLISLQINCMDRPGRREMVVVTDQHTIKIDFNKATIEQDGEIEFFNVERNDTYCAQHNAVVNNSHEYLCTYDEGREVVRMIGAIERSISHKEWICNE